MCGCGVGLRSADGIALQEELKIWLTQARQDHTHIPTPSECSQKYVHRPPFARLLTNDRAKDILNQVHTFEYTEDQVERMLNEKVTDVRRTANLSKLQSQTEAEIAKLKLKKASIPDDAGADRQQAMDNRISKLEGLLYEIHDEVLRRMQNRPEEVLIVAKINKEKAKQNSNNLRNAQSLVRMIEEFVYQ